MTAQELDYGLRWAYREFYSWPNIYGRLPDAKRQWAAYLFFNALYRKLGSVVSCLGKLGIMGSLTRLARALAYPERTKERTRMNTGLRSGIARILEI
jgi:hypothetical protein